MIESNARALIIHSPNMDLLSIKLFEYLQIYTDIISTEQCTFMFEYNLMIWSLYFIWKFSGDYNISLVA